MSGEVVEVVTPAASIVEVFVGAPGRPGADAEGGGAVDSVAGKTGVVVLDKGDVGLAAVDNTADADKPVSTAQATALAGKAATVHTHAQSDVTGLTSELAAKAPLASPAFTGTPTGITKSHVGLGNVDNTADTAKPVSAAQQAALDLKAPLASPAFTGNPTVPTASPGDNDTSIANTAFVAAAVSAVGGSGMNGQQPYVEVGLRAETLTGGAYAFSEWTVTVATAFYLTSLDFIPGSTQSYELKIDGVTVTTLAGTAATMLTFPVASTLSVGAHTFRITPVSSSAQMYYGSYPSGSSVIYAGPFYSFTVSSWTVNAGLEPCVRYKIGGHGSEFRANTIPNFGTWAKGQIVWNSQPAASGYIGWVCVTSGTPGSWKGFGLIQA